MFLKHDARPSSDDALRRTHWQRRIILILSLLAVLAISLNFNHVPGLFAQSDTQALLDQPMGNKERLDKGVDEFNHDQFEEALTDLQQVNGDLLAPADRENLNTYLARAESSANQRKAARADFEQGEQALAAGNPGEAAAHYKSALRNKFVDEGTKAKCREELAVANSMVKQSGKSLKDMYAQAVDDYKNGNLQSARDKFQQLDAADYHAGLFRKSPSDYLQDINSRLPAPAPAVAQTPTPAPQVVPTPTPAPVVQESPTPQVATTPTPTPAPVVVAPPAPAPVTPPPPAPPVVATVPPPSPQPAPVTPVPPAAQEDQSVAAKSAYRMAREEYRTGDWAAARKHFQAARDMDYKPGLFEDPPEKYLAR
ncbi:MAG TPA: hypothetical protein VKK61_11950, partial [Tepidisphaeraceae bacterium]|nr:hypothetical protein [Tepidisphaeraceae bacterium]